MLSSFINHILHKQEEFVGLCQQVTGVAKEAYGIVVKYNIQKFLEDSKMQDLARCDSKSNGRWTRDEHLKFLEGLRVYGKNWKKIQQLVQTRSGSQIRSHAQKFFLKLKDPSKSDLSEHTQNSPDSQPEPEELIGNSKMVSETGVAEEDFSYFMGRIVDYVASKNWNNFWTDLIDCKTSNLPQQNCNQCHSFLMIGGEQKQQSSPGILHK